MKLSDLLIFLLIGVIVFLLFQKRPMYSANRLQTIEHIIEGKDSIVTIWKTKIIEDKTKIKGMSRQIQSLKDSLVIAKQLKDTITIIEYQDTIIKQQDTTIRLYEDLTSKSDSVITNQNKTIELKDEIISIQRNQIKETYKKNKRLKLSSIVAGAGLLTILIIK